MSSKFGDLNSIIMEGKLTSKPIISNKCCTFDITNETYVYCEETKADKKQQTIFTICTTGNTAILCNSYLSIGKIIRLRGTLQSSNNNVFILANHIEFRQSQKEQKDVINESQIS